MKRKGEEKIRGERDGHGIMGKRMGRKKEGKVEGDCQYREKENIL